ncbi:MAG TPA: hypothetical protein VGK47_13235 [Nitrososphaeraceae archaeon]
MKRLEFLALLASPALIFLPKEEPKKVGVFVGDKHIATLDQITFTKDGEEVDLSNYQVTCKVYKMSAKHIKVSDEFINTFK